ncbi:MAG: sulfurtransferase [Alphaproteobacteria bacterium]|nr:sulfurtransferase [Alphaproteobacteria bacterium]
MTDRLVTPDWLEEHLDDPNVVILEFDWTGTESYDDWHIPGAHGFFWKDLLWDDAIRDFPSPELFAERCAALGISDDTTVVCYGDPVQFGTYGWWVFTYLGHKDVRLLNGGRVLWEKQGRPMTSDAPTRPTPASYTPKGARNDSMRVRFSEILERLDALKAGDDAILLDHRSPEEYKGERVNMIGAPDVGAERAGRIPGARHLFFDEFLNDDMTFKSAEELRSLLSARGATADKDVISYCRLSHRATLAYFVMTELLGYESVRSYDGSWTEWGSLVGVPIEK